MCIFNPINLTISSCSIINMEPRRYFLFVRHRKIPLFVRHRKIVQNTSLTVNMMKARLSHGWRITRSPVRSLRGIPHIRSNEAKEFSCISERRHLSEYQSTSPFDLSLMTAMSYLAWSETAAWAEDMPVSGITYNGAAGEDFLKNAAGTAYVILVGFFLYRVLARRAKRAREQVSLVFLYSRKSLSH